MRIPNLCFLLCCPVLCQADGTPALCISASAALPYVGVCSVLVVFVFSLRLLFFSCPFISAFRRVSCVALAPPVGHRSACLIFRALCCCSLLSFSLLSFFYLAFRLVLSCHPSVGPSPRHMVGLCQQTATLSPRDSACALRACMKCFVSFYFLSFLFYSFLSFVFSPFCPSLPFFLQQ